MPNQTEDGYIYGQIVYGSILAFWDKTMEVLSIAEAGQELGGN